jgi:hypothetical protein
MKAYRDNRVGEELFRFKLRENGAAIGSANRRTWTGQLWAPSHD